MSAHITCCESASASPSPEFTSSVKLTELQPLCLESLGYGSHLESGWHSKLRQTNKLGQELKAHQVIISFKHISRAGVSPDSRSKFSQKPLRWAKTGGWHVCRNTVMQPHQLRAHLHWKLSFLSLSLPLVWELGLFWLPSNASLWRKLAMNSFFMHMIISDAGHPAWVSSLNLPGDDAESAADSRPQTQPCDRWPFSLL